MPFSRFYLIAAAPAIIVAGACAHDAPRSDSASAPPASAANDSTFAALKQRGADARAMGVNQYTSTHRFDALADGGRIELQRDVDDSAGTAQIRRHLREVATAFAAGDFRTPVFVHARNVTGTDVMAAKHSVITYTVHDLPRGAEVRITTHDADAIRAVHAFLAFQRGEHHAAGSGDAPHAHSGNAAQ